MRVIAAALLACLPLPALAAPTYGPRLEGFDYGYPVKTFALESQRQPLEMAYLDIAPKQAPIGVVVLLHGKNFCGANQQYPVMCVQRQRDATYRMRIPYMLVHIPSRLYRHA